MREQWTRELFFMKLCYLSGPVLKAVRVLAKEWVPCTLSTLDFAFGLNVMFLENSTTNKNSTYLYAGMSGFAIITASRWNRPSPRYLSIHIHYKTYYLFNTVQSQIYCFVLVMYPYQTLLYYSKQSYRPMILSLLN